MRPRAAPLRSAARSAELDYLGRLPSRRGQRSEVVTVGHAGSAREHVAQVNRRILAVALPGDDQRLDDRRTLAGVGVADKKPVLWANRLGPDGVFGKIVVDTSWWHPLEQRSPGAVKSRKTIRK